jgi:hypothetical protein
VDFQKNRKKLNTLGGFMIIEPGDHFIVARGQLLRDPLEDLAFSIETDEAITALLKSRVITYDNTYNGMLFVCEDAVDGCVLGKCVGGADMYGRYKQFVGRLITFNKYDHQLTTVSKMWVEKVLKGSK